MDLSQACKRQYWWMEKKIDMYIEIIDVCYKLARIVSVGINIAKELKSYINGKKDSKKDPSSSLPAPDGSDEDC